MEFDVKLSGFRELLKGLEDLPKNLAKNALRRSVAAGASVVRAQTKTNALAIKQTGTLARSIYQKQIREKSSATRQTFYVGARSGKQYKNVGKKGASADAYYARWVELGHFTRHGLKNANRGQRDNATLARAVQAGTVHWVPAKPFLRPAFDTKKEAAIDAMGASLGLSLTSEAERIRIATGQ